MIKKKILIVSILLATIIILTSFNVVANEPIIPQKETKDNSSKLNNKITNTAAKSVKSKETLTKSEQQGIMPDADGSCLSLYLTYLYYGNKYYYYLDLCRSPQGTVLDCEYAAKYKEYMDQALQNYYDAGCGPHCLDIRTPKTYNYNLNILILFKIMKHLSLFEKIQNQLYN